MQKQGCIDSFVVYEVVGDYGSGLETQLKVFGGKVCRLNPLKS